MEQNFEHSLNMLRLNDADDCRNVLEILGSICNNIIKSPDNEKYRKLRFSNPIVLGKLLPVFGAIEFLRELGFKKDGDLFLLPRNSPISIIRKAANVLQTFEMPTSIVFKSFPPDKLSSEVKKQYATNVFLQRIIDEFNYILNYEDEKLHECVKLVVPFETLQLKALKKLRDFQKNIKLARNEKKDCDDAKKMDEMSIEDILLMEIMHWFKNEFFTWMNVPNCKKCSKAMKFDDVENFSDSKISRVEKYKCNSCDEKAILPRFIDHKILLMTRTGRCGEWANVFTLICRTFGYDARIVHDQTDHVWTEVWSVYFNRWIHLDPCEDAFDRPLLYEKGWTKKLTYIIAYSKDEVQDVTWRYTRDQLNVVRRRTLCSETDLANLLLQLNNTRATFLNNCCNYKARQEFVVKRKLMEFVEFLSLHSGLGEQSNADGDEYGGRISGDISWKLARGECSEENQSYTWKIPTEINTFQLKYYIVDDIYEAIHDNCLSTTKQGWTEGIHSHRNIFRKTENDWKMVYLARSPGSEKGTITWILEIINNEEVDIDFLEFSANFVTFESGKITWKLQGFKNNKMVIDLIIDDGKNFKTNQVKNINKLNIIAELEGGSGDIKWQHAQLFRESLNSEKQLSMQINIKMNGNCKL